MNTETLRVLQLGKFWPIRGGIEKVASDLTTGLAAKGLSCDMMCAASSGRGRTETLAPNSRLILCRTWAKVAATMIAPSMPWVLRRICKDYDIIHIHHPDPMAAAALRLSGYRGKVVLHWHSDIGKQTVLLHLYRPLQSWLLRRADLVLCTSPVYMKESPWLQGVQDKTACLPIGVPPICPDTDGEGINTGAAISPLKQFKDKKMVFSLGRLVPYKGFVHLIRAAALLPDDYVVLIGGEGPLRHSLSETIRKCGLQDKVKLLGRISEEQLTVCFKACTLFCLPSVQKTEAFGIVQIEAMSCGKPVVATRIPCSGVSWVNAHGESGLNVAPGDERGLAEAIEAVAGDAAAYRKFCEGARLRYERLFTQKEMIDKCLDFYSDLWEKQRN